jgi:dTDP-4-dehydrorhamnose reductase
MNNVVLVTGSYGQLGQSIKLLSGSYGFSFHFHDKDTLDLADFENLNAFVKGLGPSVIINCAAYNAVDKAEKEVESALTLNSDIPGTLARLAHEYNCRLIHVSTDYVFDGKNHIPYTEDDIPNPGTMYGKSKLEGENKVLAFPEHTVIRTSWLYSQFGHNFVKTILELGKTKAKINVVWDQIGTPTYAGDLADAVLRITESVISDTDTYSAGLYQYSNEGVCSWYDFATEVLALANINCHVNPIESAEYSFEAQRPFYSVLNKKKIKTTYHLIIPHWKASLKTCLHHIGNEN